MTQPLLRDASRSVHCHRTSGAGRQPPVLGLALLLLCVPAAWSDGAADEVTSAVTLSGGGSGDERMTGGSGGAEPDTEWVDLFNGVNLDGWVAHDGGRSNNRSLPVSEVFHVANGEIHVYPGAANGSVQRFANLRHETPLGGKYVLHVEYRWGDNRFASSTDASRGQADRDAGILFHITGSDIDKVFPDSLEMQIGDSAVGGPYVTGDLWVLGVPTVAEVPINGRLTEVGRTGGASVPHRTSVRHENAHGEWNVCEVTVNGADEAIFMLNGKEVNRIYNFSYNGRPLDRGFVSLQAEWAEVFYRNVRYKPL